MPETSNALPGGDDQPRLESNPRFPEGLGETEAIIEGPLPEQFQRAMNAYPDLAVLTFVTQDRQGKTKQHVIELLQVGNTEVRDEWHFLGLPPGIAVRPGENRREAIQKPYVRGRYSTATRRGSLTVDPTD